MPRGTRLLPAAAESSLKLPFYRNILPELGKTQRAIALDLPGYGLSGKPLDVRYGFNFYADILDGFLDALDIGDTNLCVHDLGGPVGLYWALRHPGRVPKLTTRTDVADLIGSSQSRVAETEAGGPSVSADLLIRALLALATASPNSQSRSCTWRPEPGGVRSRPWSRSRTPRWPRSRPADCPRA